MQASKVAPPQLSIDQIADLVQLGRDGEHVLDAQAGREQRLVGVAQDDIGDRKSVGWLHAGLDLGVEMMLDRSRARADRRPSGRKGSHPRMVEH
jgi:hypothetical protein